MWEFEFAVYYSGTSLDRSPLIPPLPVCPSVFVPLSFDMERNLGNNFMRHCHNKYFYFKVWLFWITGG